MMNTVKRNKARFNLVKKYILNGPTALVIAAGVSVGFGFAPHFASAQDGPVDTQVESQDFRSTSPLEGGERRRDNRRQNAGRIQPFLAEELGIDADQLATARNAARDAAQESGDFEAELAAALGIASDVLESAYEAAREAALAQAIEEGRISEEEAALREAQRDLQEAVDRTEIVADALNITVEELEEAREAGTSPRELAKDLGIDRDTLRANVEESRQAAIDQAVADGAVTQEQVDALTEQAEGDNGRGNRENRDNRGNRGNRDSRSARQAQSDAGPNQGGDDGPNEETNNDNVSSEENSQVQTTATSTQSNNSAEDEGTTSNGTENRSSDNPEQSEEPRSRNRDRSNDGNQGGNRGGNNERGRGGRGNN